MDVDEPSGGERIGSTRLREEDQLPAAKKARLTSDDDGSQHVPAANARVTEAEAKKSQAESGESQYIFEDLLPPSRALLPSSKLVERPADQPNLTFEADVGIIEYVSNDVPPIQGIIKQRFTDFLVFEIDSEYKVVRLNSIDKPEQPPPKATTSAQDALPPASDAQNDTVAEGTAEEIESGEHLGDPVTDVAASEDPLLTDNVGPASIPAQGIDSPDVPSPPDEGAWLGKFTTKLSSYLSPEVIEKLKHLFLEGPTPPLVSDAGWGGMKKLSSSEDPSSTSAVTASNNAPEPTKDNRDGGRGRHGGRGRGDRGRGGRGGRGGGGGGGGREPRHEDNRKVVSDPMPNKADRTGLHQAIRELFAGRLESEVENGTEGDTTRISIHWNQRPPRNPKSNKPGRNPRDPRDPSTPFIPPYIHFTLQKANRDTQDALSHISRMLKCSIKELAVAGTKDKRGVTTQRVSLKRGKRTVEDVWKAVNNVPRRRSVADAITIRGERGVRIGDLVYRKSPLDLGHLKGNAFVITLRNVKESEDVINRAMQSMKERGFINYYGMQRFGTSSIPTHSIGLALLKSDWKQALSLILRPRPGETEEAEAGRRAWLEEHDLGKALQLMPRRMVAERCVLEAFKRNFNSDSDMQGALHAIPKNLRTMYVHAYQSYVWNAIVSERLLRFGFEPVPGDLVFDPESLGKKNRDKKGPDVPTPVGADDDEEQEVHQLLDSVDVEDVVEAEPDQSKKHLTVKTKTLTESDLSHYTIFDVIMPLPGFDVNYPGGELGDKYRAFMKMDGLDPDNMTRERKDYSLSGSYRKIMHLPKEVSWKILRYTDPEVPLAQSDEDRILGIDQPGPRQDGKFTALQIELQLGSAVYATMALREVTKTETSSHYQTVLTQGAEDQAHKGSVDAVMEDA